jgi:hypothetical protein
MSIRANSNLDQNTQVEGVFQTLFGPNRHCLLQLDIVRPLPDFVRPSQTQLKSKPTGPTRLRPVLSDFVRFSRTLSGLSRTLSGVHVLAQQLFSLSSLYIAPHLQRLQALGLLKFMFIKPLFFTPKASNTQL